MSEIEKIAKSLNMRVGQLIYNALDWHGNMHSLFYVTDSSLVTLCKAYAKSLKK